MKVLMLLRCVLTSLFLALPACMSAKQPNVIFILADDLGWRDLGCFGSDFYETPHLDDFAVSGMKFTNAYSASPMCSPTRASILTGQEPGRLRLTVPHCHLRQEVLDPVENEVEGTHFKVAAPGTRTRLPNEYMTFAEVLKDNGYRTAFMGKWHLGRHPYLPENQGFDLVVGGREHPGPPPPGHFFSPWNCETLPLVPEGTHVCDVLTDEAISFISEKKDDPFLLCLWYYDVHAPFQGKEDLKKYYAGKLRPGNMQRSPTMGAMVGNMDANFGRLMDKLRESGKDEETIIIFFSDNGGNQYNLVDGTTPTNNEPLRAGKGNNYEGGVRVPMIVRVPGLTKSGSESDVVVSSVDHYVTLLELLGIPFPEEQLTDGFSYLPALKGKTYTRPPAYFTFCHNMTATGNRANISVREGPWKFYKFYHDGPEREHRYELYNLEEDISESRNLAGDFPERAEKMNAMINAHVEEAGILLPRLNVNYSGNMVDAWQGNDNTELAMEDKVLYIRSLGTDPQVITEYKPIIDEGVFLFEFSMKSGSSGAGSLSWKLKGDMAFSGENSAGFEPRHDNQWHKYSLDMPVKGRLSTIMLNPSSGRGDIYIKDIRMLSEDGYLIREWTMY